MLHFFEYVEIAGAATGRLRDQVIFDAFGLSSSFDASDDGFGFI
jgi:hypothetical protein